MMILLITLVIFLQSASKLHVQAAVTVCEQDEWYTGIEKQDY